jgi:hypothetical protein
LRERGKDAQSHETLRDRAQGLVVGEDDRLGLENIVNLLNSGNEDQGFRYFSSGTTVTADLAWTRDIIDQFMIVVGREVERRDPIANEPPRPAKMIMTVKVT